ncbi:hypothetical protein K402DRAFT_300402, partial [Aulographum hederae CBS 113979]
SPLLALPCEIRLQILSYLVLPSPPDPFNPLPPIDYDHRTRTAPLDHHAYSPSSSIVPPHPSHPILELRLIDPTHVLAGSCAAGAFLRTPCTIRSDRFRARTMSTTYHFTSPSRLYPAILATCAQLHDEGAELLYGTCVFSFDTHVEAIVPFLGDLTPFSRKMVRRLALVKRGLPYEREFDRAEWEGMCRFLAREMRLLHLDLGVVAGRPGEQGWDGVKELRKEDFEACSGIEGMEWVEQAADIRTKNVTVRAIVEHCPTPRSERMAWWVMFSKSVEGGFAEFVKGLIV